MNTPLLPKSKLSYDRSFDDMASRRHLLFRLHSLKLNWTFFHSKEKVLVASLHRQRLHQDSSSGDLSLTLTALEKEPLSLTLGKDSDAVEKHITSWHNRGRRSEEPSNYISLTFNVLYVLWMWKRRLSFLPHSEGRQDDFTIIVLDSSKFRNGKRAKLGTELLSRDKQHKDAHKFAEAHDEVIVDKYIPSEAVLGSMPMSKLEVFIPSWYPKPLETNIPGSKKFLDSLPPAVDKVNCTMVRESLRFALALLAPMLVPGEQHCANIGSGKEAVLGTIEDSRSEGMNPMAEPTRGHETVLVSGRRVAEGGGNRTPASYGKRNCSPEMGSLLVGSTGGPEPPAKRRRLSEEEQPLHRVKNENVGPSNAERDGQASVESLKWEWECVAAFATEMCRVNEEGREECQRLHEAHGLELLKRYRTAMQRDLGMEPLETLLKIMNEYRGWDEGTS